MNDYRIILYGLIIPIVVNVTVPTIFGILIRKSKKRELKMDTERFTIYFLSLKTVITVSVFMGVCSVLIFVGCYLGEDPHWYIGLICTAVAIPELLIMYRQKIVVDGDTIKSTKAFGRTMEYKFSEIDYISISKYKGLIGYDAYKNSKRIFSCTHLQAGARLFFEKAQKHNVPIRNVPAIPPTLY